MLVCAGAALARDSGSAQAARRAEIETPAASTRMYLSFASYLQSLVFEVQLTRDRVHDLV
jgi:hypothetical protein